MPNRFELQQRVADLYRQGEPLLAPHAAEIDRWRAVGLSLAEARRVAFADDPDGYRAVRALERSLAGVLAELEESDGEDLLRRMGRPK